MKAKIRKLIVSVEETRQDMGKAVEPKHGGPEYETLSTFGSYCGVKDLQARYDFAGGEGRQ